MKNGKSQKEKGKKIVFNAALILCFFIGAYAGGYVCGNILAAVDNGEVNTGVLLLGLLAVIYLSTFLHIIIHESGHLVFGLATGYRFSSFRISGLMLAKINGKLCLKRHKVAGTGGQCLMAPPETENGKIPYVMYNLGGVLLDMTVSLACMAVYFFARPESVFLSSSLLVFAVFGIVLSFINGIPVSNGLMVNDGGNIVQLSKSEKARKSFWYQLKIYSELSEGVRLKDMPEEWFPIPEGEDLKNGLVCATGVFACNRLFDYKNFDAARELIDKLTDENAGTIGIHKNQLVCDKIFCELIGYNNPEVINELLDKPQKSFMKSMKDNPSVIRTNYALALLHEKDKEKAENFKMKFDKREKNYAFAADIQSERELIEIVEQMV